MLESGASWLRSRVCRHAIKRAVLSPLSLSLSTPMQTPAQMSNFEAIQRCIRTREQGLKTCSWRVIPKDCFNRIVSSLSFHSDVWAKTRFWNLCRKVNPNAFLVWIYVIKCGVQTTESVQLIPSRNGRFSRFKSLGTLIVRRMVSSYWIFGGSCCSHLQN